MVKLGLWVETGVWCDHHMKGTAGFNNKTQCSLQYIWTRFPMWCFQAPTHAHGLLLLHTVGPQAQCLRDDFLDHIPRAAQLFLLGEMCKVKLTWSWLEDIHPDLGADISVFFLVVMTPCRLLWLLDLNTGFRSSVIQKLCYSGVYILYSSGSA